MGNRADAHDPSASRTPSQRIREGMSRVVWTSLRQASTQVGSPTSRARIEAAARGHKYCLVMEPERSLLVGMNSNALLIRSALL